MIGIVSDSHIPSRAESFPVSIKHKLDDCESVIHCGDFDKESFYDQFTTSFPDATCIAGNCDVLGLDSSATVSYQDVTVGMYHGSGIQPRGHRPTLANIASEKLQVDVLIHGHTHTSMAAREHDSILINPGSCTGVGGGSASVSQPTMRTMTITDTAIRTTEWTVQDGVLREMDQTTFER